MKTFQQFMSEAALVYDTFPEGEVSINEFFGIKKVVKKKEVTPEQRKEFLRQLQKQAKMPAHMSDVARRTNEDYDLSETSLTRLMRHSQKGGMAIMSAQRGNLSKKENKARSKSLEGQIRGAGLPGPTKVSGRYTENPGTPDEQKVGEKSHVITSGKMGKRRFKKTVKKLGKQYDQDSVLIQRKPGGSATLTGTSRNSWPGENKNVNVGSMKPGRTGEFDTKVKNKTFTYEP